MPAHCRVQIILHYSMQPAAHAPPVGYGMPAAFSVRVAGGGRCSVSAVPVALFDGTAEFMCMWSMLAMVMRGWRCGAGRLGTWMRQQLQRCLSPVAGPGMWSSTSTCWTGRNDITPLDACGDFGIFSLALSLVLTLLTIYCVYQLLPVKLTVTFIS